MALKQWGLAAGVCSLAVLTACGGGNDSTSATASTLTPTAAAADKYVGTWSGCFAEGGGSRLDTIVLSKTGDASLTANWQEAYYAATGCSGTPTNTNTGVANVTLVGTKTIGADTVDKADILQSTPGAQAEKQVLGVLNGQLAMGITAQDNGPVDAQGYPNSLDASRLAKKSDAADPSASAKAYPMPNVGMEVSPAPEGSTYTAQLCYAGVTQCTPISPSIFVSTAERLAAGSDIPASIAYAQEVAKAFNQMLVNLWQAKTYPPPSTLEKVFSDAIAADLANDTHNAVAAAGAAFAAAGFPAASGAGAGAGTGSGSGNLAACNALSYPGGISDPQTESYDAIAQFDACAYAATGNSAYLTDGNNQCKVLAGVISFTGSTFKPLFCSGSSLKL